MFKRSLPICGNYEKLRQEVEGQPGDMLQRNYSKLHPEEKDNDDDDVYQARFQTTVQFQ